MDVFEIAKYIINAPIYVDHLKLQKLIFYSQAISLVANEKSLFSDSIVAWKYGPVVEKVYEEYKIYRNEEIPRDDDERKFSEEDVDDLESIDASLELYSAMSGIALMRKTHREDPWKDAFKNGEGSIISSDSIKNYYKKTLIIS